MEPVQKKAKITGHFRVALKPQDVNLQPTNKKFKKLHDIGKENIEVITISDGEDEEEENLKENKLSTVVERVEVPRKVVKKPPTSKSQAPINRYIAPPGLHPGVVDYDRVSLHDIHYEPHYAWDSFRYDREREIIFRTRKYIEINNIDHHITPLSRARYIDWIVRMQDAFSLWHDSIYMAVKMADLYLMRKSVPKDYLQLLYLTALLISVKFEERLPTVDISELIHITRGIYTRDQIIKFEVEILSTLNFNIRFPLSFGFLRRYVHVTRSSKEALNLSRYILETSLLDYEMIEELESKMAAASLLLAFKMLQPERPWSVTAEFYTGYKQEELHPLLTRLNFMISQPTNRRLSSIRHKYSHELFMAVAVRFPPLSNV